MGPAQGSAAGSDPVQDLTLQPASGAQQVWQGAVNRGTSQLNQSSCSMDIFSPCKWQCLFSTVVPFRLSQGFYCS